MSAPNPRDTDTELSSLLHAWTVDDRDDPQFAHKVWQQIEAERPDETAGIRGWFEALARLLARPAGAIAAIAVFAAAGALMAEISQGARHEARVSVLAAEYAHTIDPVLMSGQHSHSSDSRR